jgi:hypothetical protein
MTTDDKYNSNARKRPEYNLLEQKIPQVWIIRYLDLEE